MKEVLQAIARGDFKAAEGLQRAIVERLDGSEKQFAGEVERLSYIYFQQGKYSQSHDLLLRHYEALSSRLDGRLEWNLAVINYLAGDLKEAERRAIHAYNTYPDYASGTETLARIYGRQGKLKEAKRWGENALMRRDKEVCSGEAPVFPIPPRDPPAFNPNEPSTNVIAFSLWGDDERYLGGALDNARIAGDSYPGWTLRFYIEEGTSPVLVKDLLKLRCQVTMCGKQKLPFEGLFWRFNVINEKGLARFLIRDTDTIFCEKECKAVEAWLASNSYFHVMRDYYEQTDLIDVGLWGGVVNIFPPLQKLLDQFKPGMPSRMVDQRFANAFFWPTVKQSVLHHDSFYRVLNSVEFPAAKQPDLPLGLYKPPQKQ